MFSTRLQLCETKSMSCVLYLNQNTYGESKTYNSGGKKMGGGSEQMVLFNGSYSRIHGRKF